MVENLHGGAHLGAAHPHRADRAGIEEPVQHVEVMAILLDDEIARVIAIAEPVPQLLDFRIRVRDALERILCDPEGRAHSRARRSGRPGAACMLPGTPDRSAAGIRPKGSSSDPALRPAAIACLNACQIHAHGLFAIDVLLGFHRGFEHARMLERRSGDHHGIDIGCQQLLEILVVFGFCALICWVPFSMRSSNRSHSAVTRARGSALTMVAS